MASYGEPDWVTASPSPQVVTQQAGGISTTVVAQTDNNTSYENPDVKHARILVGLLSVVDILLCFGMATLGVLMLIEYDPTNITEFEIAFVAAYMILFACLLFTYEFIWWQPIKSVNRTFRKNFGFLYGLKGKGFYMLGVSCLCLGPMGDAFWSHRKEGAEKLDEYLPFRGLDYAVLFGWLILAVVQIFIGCANPTVRDVYCPPTATFDVGANPNVVANTGGTNATP